MNLQTKLLQEQVKKTQNSPDDPEFKIKPQSKNFIDNVILSVVLLSFNMGYTAVYFNTFDFQDLMNILNLTFDKSFTQGLLTSCIPASACIGALLTSRLLTIFSRRQFFYITNIILIFGILLIQTKNMLLIILGRLLQELMIGIGTTIVPLYIKEFIPQMNGKYGLYNQLLYTFGIVQAFFLNLILHSVLGNPESYWRYLFAFPLTFSLVQMLICKLYYTFQTPRYLISVNKNKQARDLLQKIYKQQFVEQQFQLLHDAVHSKCFQKNHIELKQCSSLKGIKKVQQSSQYEENPLHQLEKMSQVEKTKNKSYTNPLTVFCALHLSFQQQIVGIGIVIVYSGDIIKEVIPSMFYYYAIIIHSIGFCAVSLGIFLIKRYGRVTLIQTGASIISVCLLMTGINFLLKENGSALAIGVAVIILRATFSCTLGPIPLLYMPEIVKPNIIPYGTFINYTIATLLMFLYPILTQKFKGPGWMFIVNGILCILTIVINSLTLVETKNKNQLEIQEQFRKKMKKITGYNLGQQ